MALDKLEVFKGKWKKRYLHVITMLEGNPYLFTFFDYPQEVRKRIYTTNLIEGVNKQIKQKFKLKEQSMEKYLVTQFNQYNDKYMNRIHNGFGLVARHQWFKD